MFHRVCKTIFDTINSTLYIISIILKAQEQDLHFKAIIKINVPHSHEFIILHFVIYLSFGNTQTDLKLNVLKQCDT